MLALEHQTLPPSLNFEQPNPQIDFSASPFYVNTKCKDWPGRFDAAPRWCEFVRHRRDQCSRGSGRGATSKTISDIPAPGRVLTLSARSSNALEIMIKRLREQLEAHPELPLADVAYTLKTGRKGFSHRAIALCRDRDDALRVLEVARRDRFITVR